MLIQGVYSQHILPVAQPFHIHKGKLPPASAVGFAQCSFFPQLVGNARQLFYGPDIPELGLRAFFVEPVKEHVNAGPLMPCVHGHVVSPVVGVRPAVLPVMPGPFTTLAFRVSMPGVRPAVNKQLKQNLIIVMPYPLPVPGFFVTTGKMVPQIVTPSLLE